VKQVGHISADIDLVFGLVFCRDALTVNRILTFILIVFLALIRLHPACAEVNKLVLAYASPAATFAPGFIAKREGIFAKYISFVQKAVERLGLWKN